MRAHALAARCGEGEAEEAAFDGGNGVGELVDFVLDQLDHLLRERLAQVPFAHRPLPYYMDEGLSEDYFATRHVAEAEVGGRVFCDLLE